MHMLTIYSGQFFVARFILQYYYNVKIYIFVLTIY